jgi:tetratricopeptide (TPR) repeat protein
MYERRGDMKLQLGDVAGARADYQKYLELEMASAWPDEYSAVDDWEHRWFLARPYEKLGEANRRLGDVSASRAAYQKGLKIRRKLAHQFPNGVDSQTNVANCYWQLGSLEESVDEFPTAVRWFEQGIAVLDRSQRDGLIPNPMDHSQLDLPAWALGLRHSAAVCRAAPQAIDSLEFALAQPIKLMPELLGIRFRALARRGRNQEAAATASKLASLESADAGDLFHIGAGFALCANDMRAAQARATPSSDKPLLEDRSAARAVELLKQALAQGYFKDPVHRAELRTNSDLDVLGSRDDFQKFLTEADPAPPLPWPP